MKQQQFIVPIKLKPLKGEVVEPVAVALKFSTITIEKAQLVRRMMGEVAQQLEEVRQHTDAKARPLFPWEKGIDDGAIEIDG